jgi:spermidine synthase
MIVLDRNELMSTRMSGSGGGAGHDDLRPAGRARGAASLIGGYGMGFTPAPSRLELGRDARITVAELVPGIIEWARGPMAELTAGCLDDRRVTLAMGDVGNAIYAGAGLMTRSCSTSTMDPTG